MTHRVWMSGALGLALAACSPQQESVPPEPSVVEPSAATAPEMIQPPVASAMPSADQAPPTVDGVYVDEGACPGEGCYLQGRIKAREPVAMYQQARTDSTIAATINPGEWVEIVGTVDRLLPTPGKIVATGETVYMLGYEGEGCSTVWNKGQLTSWCDEFDGSGAGDIVWESTGAKNDPSLGFWIEVKRANGQSGWLAEDSGRSFACTGYQDRDEDCPPLQQ